VGEGISWNGRHCVYGACMLMDSSEFRTSRDPVASKVSLTLRKSCVIAHAHQVQYMRSDGLITGMAVCR
jgi:hypothetical protein